MRPGRGEARSQKAPMTGKLTARPAGRPGSCLALVSLRRFLLRLTPFTNPGIPEDLRLRFLRNAESIRPMWGVNPSLGWSNGLPPIGSNPSPRTRREEHVLPIVRMSSGPGYSLIGVIATRARLRFTGRPRLTCTFPQPWEIGHFYFARNRTFLLCRDKPKFASG